MTNKIILSISFLLINLISFSQQETTITQLYSNKKYKIENTITVNKSSITFSNKYFTIIQTREELAYLIYFHNIKSMWAGDIKNFDKEYYDYLKVLNKINEHQKTQDTNLVKRLILTKQAYLKGDSIIIHYKNIFSKINKLKKQETIANYKCTKYNYYIDTTITYCTFNSKELLNNTHTDFLSLWHIINTLNKALNIETCFNLSLLTKENNYAFPLKVTKYNKNNIIKEETVIRIRKHGLTGCECNRYKAYQKLSLVDLLMGAEAEKSK